MKITFDEYDRDIVRAALIANDQPADNKAVNKVLKSQESRHKANFEQDINDLVYDMQETL